MNVFSSCEVLQPFVFFFLKSKFIYLFIYLFLAALGHCCCTWAFPRCGQKGLLFIAVCGLLVVVASLVAEHGLQACGLSSWGSRALEHRLSSCDARAQLLHGMWDLPGPGLEPVSPALAGGFLTTAPPGKVPSLTFYVQTYDAFCINFCIMCEAQADTFFCMSMSS